MATPAPLWATAFVKKASPSSTLVNPTPVALGSISVNPAFPPFPGCTSMLRNPALSDHDDAAALLQHKLSKITMVAQAQPARFIGPAKQTTRPCQSLRAIEFVLEGVRRFAGDTNFTNFHGYNPPPMSEIRVLSEPKRCRSHGTASCDSPFRCVLLAKR